MGKKNIGMKVVCENRKARHDYFIHETYETGLWGEDFAAEYLKEKLGMVLLEQRYRTKRGEIDLIMTDGDTVVFVEVKTRRTGETGNGLSAVNLAKQKRITQAATLYLMQKNWLRKAVRFDLVEIHGFEVIHIPNAFQPYGKFQH